MAFGKKKDDPSEPVNLFEQEEAAAELELAAEGDAEGTVDAEPGAAPDQTPLAEDAPSPDPLAGGADALLSLFQEDEDVGEDRGALLDMAGEVELSDLLDDLRTLAVALSIDMSAMRS